MTLSGVPRDLGAQGRPTRPSQATARITARNEPRRSDRAEGRTMLILMTRADLEM